MTSNNQDPRDSLFQTPNPKELKEQSEKGLLTEQYPGMAMDDNAANLDDNDSDEDVDDYFKDEDTRALSSSPIINANISGG